MGKVHVFDHPLIQHKLSILRDKTTSVKEFRELISEIAMLMCYEATRDLPLVDVDVETPVATAKCRRIAGKKLAVVPILRAGLGMVDGMVSMMPNVKVGHVGLYRDPVTLDPVKYYFKMPPDIAERDVIVVAYAHVAQHGGAASHVPREGRLLQFPAFVQFAKRPVAVADVPRELRTCCEIHAGQAAEAISVLDVDGHGDVVEGLVGLHVFASCDLVIVYLKVVTAQADATVVVEQGDIGSEACERDGHVGCHTSEEAVAVLLVDCHGEILHAEIVYVKTCLDAELNLCLRRQCESECCYDDSKAQNVLFHTFVKIRECE